MPLSPDYAAALFDGEGCVGLAYDKRQDSFNAYLSIANTFRPVLETLRESWSGDVYLNQVRIRPIWVWRLRGKELTPFISVIYPSTIIKKTQLETILKFFDTVPEVQYRGAWNKLPDSVRGERRELYLELKRLKRMVYS